MKVTLGTPLSREEVRDMDSSFYRGLRVYEIKNDPLSPRYQLEWLRFAAPLEALAHPNCPSDIWWKLAELHPIEARASLLYALMTLESPGNWPALVHAKATFWLISVSALSLTERQRHLFAADCIDRALLIAELEFPERSIAIAAVAARRRLGQVELTEQASLCDEEWSTVRETALHAFYISNLGGTQKSMMFACKAISAHDAANGASAAVWNAYNTSPKTPFSARRNDELEWQWNRLLTYVDAK